MKLSPYDIYWCRLRLPKALYELMKTQGPKLVVAGGFVRSCVSGEKVSDVDCFAQSKEEAALMALELAGKDKGRIYETDNAYTIRGFKPAVQIIHRWTFPSPVELIQSFDFTIARAAFWYENERMESICDDDFYPDLAGKRIVYRAPIRDEEPGGTLLRVLKFYQRGYRIPLDSMGLVIGRLLSGVEDINFEKRKTMNKTAWEKQMGKLLAGLLREVDPAIDPDHVCHLPNLCEDDGTGEAE